jgi:hypothetical protein
VALGIRGAVKKKGDENMTPKTRPLLAALVVVTVFYAVASSAEAASLFVGGAKLSANSKVALSTTIALEEPAVLESPGLSLAISCSGLSATKPELVGEDKAEAERLTFVACSEVEPSTCKLESSTIETAPLTGLFATGTSPADKLHLKPKAGKTIATFVFSGSCAIAGEKGLNGQVTFNAPTGQSEEASQAIEASSSIENSLEIGGNKACFASGRGLLKLASGSKWSYH